MFSRLFKTPKSSLQLFRKNQAAMLPNDAESPQVPSETFSSLPIIRKVGLVHRFATPFGSEDIPHRTVRAVFPHTALRVGLVSSVSLPFAPRLRFTLIPMDAPPYGRAVSDAPPHSGLSPIAVFRHYCSRHLICIVPFTRRGPSHPQALPRFPATMASSDSSLRFRYCEASQVPD